MTIAELMDKKIAIVGAGANNRGLMGYLKANQIAFDVIEWKNIEELTGKLDVYQIIFRTPSLPYLSKPIQQALQNGAIVYSQTKLFFDNCPAKIIGVTGTKGKGTTSSLIGKILQLTGRKVWLAGNMGQDPFEFIDQIKSNDLVVMELSSFQLQDLEKSPHISVVLSISPDHLDHHKDMDEYLKAKSSILAFQKKEDFAIVHPMLPTWFKNLGLGQKILIVPSSVSDYSRKLLGEHNLENISAAVEVGKLEQVSIDVIRKAVAEFEPLPHRLQIVEKKNGITFVDDSISTNEEAAIAAIHSFNQPLIVILGGSTKGLDYSNLAATIKHSKHVKAAIVVGQVADQIVKSLTGWTGKILTGAKDMKEILDQAVSVASSGDVVILSPAAASFDMFKNYKDRGEQFIQLVKQL